MVQFSLKSKLTHSRAHPFRPEIFLLLMKPSWHSADYSFLIIFKMKEYANMVEETRIFYLFVLFFNWRDTLVSRQAPQGS